MERIERWATDPRPAKRRMLYVLGGITYLPGFYLIIDFFRWSARDSGTGDMGPGFIVVIPLSAILFFLLAGSGLVCLGAAIPIGTSGSGQWREGEQFTQTQREHLGYAGMWMLVAVATVIVLLVPGMFFLPLVLFLSLAVLPFAIIMSYVTVFGAVSLEFYRTGDAPRWVASLFAVTIAVGAGLKLADARLPVIPLLVAGIPAILVIAGYVARLPVETYFSGA